MLRSRRFLPLFAAQWFGAFADNALKSAFGFLIVYGGVGLLGLPGELAVTVGGAVFVLPFLLCSGLAGRLSDAVDKAAVVRWTRIAEIGLALLAGASLLLQSGELALGTIFLYGVQSAVFGPAKYAILPQHLPEHRLVTANAWIEASTFVAILVGMLFGGLAAGFGGTSVLAAGLAVAALAGVAASRFVPAAPPEPGAVPFRFAPVTATIDAIRAVRRRRDVFLSVLGISWFWAVGLVVISIFPEVAKTVLGVNQVVANVLVGAFVVGIALGSALASRLLHGDVSPRFAPLAALGMALALLDLSAAAGSIAGAGNGGAQALSAFLASEGGIRVLLDLVLIAAFGGLFTVPLYAILQAHAPVEARSSAIAGNNVINALVMTACSAAAAVLLYAGLSVLAVIAVLGIGNLIVAAYTVRLIPDQVVKSLGRTLLRLLHRARVTDAEHYGDGASPAVVVANHTSFLDALLLGCFLPGRPVFAINTHIARKWWVKPAFLFFELLPVDPTSPFAVRTMVKRVQEGRRLVIFPEGRITVTGALMKVYDGPAMIAALAGVPVIPVRIDGAQYSIFSRLGGKVRRRLFPRIALTVLPPRRVAVPDGLIGRSRRAFAGARLQEIMTEMVYRTSPVDRPLFRALIDSARLHGRTRVLEDIERDPAGYRRVLTGAFALGRALGRRGRPGERVGVLLPNAVGSVIVFFALHAVGRVPAMLNFTAGAANMAAAIKAAGIERVLTSRRFVEAARLTAVVEALGDSADIVHLEDLRGRIGVFGRLYGLIAGRLPGLFWRLGAGRRATAEDEAVVLFTSGSEGTPKGVSLSHRNIQANRYQISAQVDFTGEDVVLNALPLFHSFGLTAGLLLPMLAGVKVFLYPSPLHYRIVPEIAYDTNATILFGTDTFLAGYARMAHAYDFYSLRYAFAGAEKVRAETRRTWAEKFGVRILEGYGCTETAPVLAINSPIRNRPGTVGRLLPGIEARLEPVPGVAEGGRLFVRGPNVMRGYLRVENPGVLEPPAEGWHDTGDVVAIDTDGFVSILGRAKRFAKVAGEMVSLAAVEALASDLWPDGLYAAIALPHDRKGEQVVLVTDREGAALADLSRHARAKGAAEIMVPRRLVIAARMPLLGTGKIDHNAARVLALGESAGPAAPDDTARQSAAKKPDARKAPRKVSPRSPGRRSGKPATAAP
ncbi:MAG: acyl-[ACP]--phospholipid O-acyltransferase [Inquilinus sp.]|nr:acyl-[ACP]--phospholipid O-acyltransferase [Inquilinus sp.]